MRLVIDENKLVMVNREPQKMIPSFWVQTSLEEKPSLLTRPKHFLSNTAQG